MRPSGPALWLFVTAIHQLHHSNSVVWAAPCKTLNTQEECSAGGSSRGKDVGCVWCGDEIASCDESQAACDALTTTGEDGDVPAEPNPGNGVPEYIPLPPPPGKEEGDADADDDDDNGNDNDNDTANQGQGQNNSNAGGNAGGNNNVGGINLDDNEETEDDGESRPNQGQGQDNSNAGGKGGGNNGDGGGDMDARPGQGGDKASFCRPHATQEDCEAAPERCAWCEEAEKCAANQGACNQDDTDEEATIENGNSGQGQGNSGGRGNSTNEDGNERGNQGQGQGNGRGNETSVDSDDDDEARGNGNGPNNVNCNAIGKNETECTAAGSCFWCTEQEVCRTDFGKCPGAGRFAEKPNICAPLRDEGSCTASEECVWCEYEEVCRGSEQECPGNGRGNICKDLDEADCETSDNCAWLEGLERCGSARGSSGMIDKGDNSTQPRGANLCPILADEANCTAHAQCRWCEDSCTKASESCADGSLGTRGNPCNDLDTEELCGAVAGCIFCSLGNNTKCKKATFNACFDDNDDGNDIESSDGRGDSISNGQGRGRGNLCNRIDAEPECEAEEECQWCEAQLRCRRNATECTEPLREPDLEFDEETGGKFKVQDRGLGPTDPNTVSVVLRHLYEITDEGETIDASLVDLEVQEYKIKQSFGDFFDGVLARRTSFEAEIEGVGKIEMTAFVMMSNGNITSGEETWEVQFGDVKFNVELKNWVFCDATSSPCGNSTETSAFIDVAFEIQGKSGSPEQNEDNALLFDLGGNVPLILSNQVEVDGSIQELPEGFPRVESTATQGMIFMFRFPKFVDKVEYDPVIPYSYSIPIIEITQPEAEDETDAPSVTPSEAPTTPKPNEKEEDDGLSGGAIAGVVIGVLIASCLCCAGVGALVASRNKNAGVDDDHGKSLAGDDEEKANITIGDRDNGGEESDGESFDDE